MSPSKILPFRHPAGDLREPASITFNGFPRFAKAYAPHAHSAVPILVWDRAAPVKDEDQPPA